MQTKWKYSRGLMCFFNPNLQYFYLIFFALFSNVFFLTFWRFLNDLKYIPKYFTQPLVLTIIIYQAIFITQLRLVFELYLPSIYWNCALWFSNYNQVLSLFSPIKPGYTQEINIFIREYSNLKHSKKCTGLQVRAFKNYKK